MSPGKNLASAGGNRFLGVVRQAAQNEGLAVSDKLDDVPSTLETSKVGKVSNEFRWMNASMKTSRMTVLEHVKASEVLLCFPYLHILPMLKCTSFYVFGYFTYLCHAEHPLAPQRWGQPPRSKHRQYSRSLELFSVVDRKDQYPVACRIEQRSANS